MNNIDNDIKNIIKKINLFDEKIINNLSIDIKIIINTCNNCNKICGHKVKLIGCICKENIICFNCLDYFYDNNTNNLNILFNCKKCNNNIIDYEIL